FNLAALFISMLLRPPIATLFPYTTLFRSDGLGKQVNKLTNKVLLKTYLLFIFTLLFVVNNQALHAQETNPQNGEKYIIGGITVVDRKSTRLNSSHVKISYAVFCLKKKKDV